MTKIVLTRPPHSLESNPNRNQASPREETLWLEAIADVSEDAIIGQDLSGLVTAWKGAAEKMFGYTAEEIVGQPITHIIPPERADEEALILDRVRNGAKIRQFETERRSKAGKPIPVSINLSPIRDDTSTIIGATELARDLTDLQRINEDLKRREALLGSILGTVPDALIVLDEFGIIQSFSAAAEQLFGFSAGEVEGQHVSCLRLDADWGQNGSYLQRYISTGEQFPNEIGRRKDGSTFPMAVTFGKVNRPGPRLFTVFVRDMTERDERERKLQDALAGAEQANRAKSRFLASMSHELRTPLNGILGYARLLRLEGGLNSAQDARVGAMLQAGEHLLQMVACVLDLTEIEAEHVDLKRVNCNVHAVVAAALDLIRPIAEVKGLALSLTVSPGTQQQLVTDPGRLRQIVTNLLGNAVKYTVRGEIELRLRSVMQNSTLRIEVVDTGCGVAAADRQRLFQDFERFGPAHTVEGTGLGLSLSARLAALMGGRLGHDDNPGGGSIFWLELPLNPTVTSQPSATPATNANHAKQVVLPPRSLRVLVVDDNLMNREIAATYLRAGGHTVICVESGAEAVMAASTADFDIALMDVCMPGMDGLEATRRIRALSGTRGRVRIIALTSQAFTEQIAECLEAGMDGHLAKPFEMDELLSAVACAAGAELVNGATLGPDPGPSAFPPVPIIPMLGADLPILNPIAFNRIASHLPPDAIVTYLRTIAEQGRSLLDGLRQTDALTGANEELAEGAHTLAGGAGMLGFERLATLGRRFERAIQSSPADVPVFAVALSAVIEATLQSINDRMSTIEA
jgi:PAS domain S-box-containing protein